MTRKDLIDNLANRTGFSKKQTDEFLRNLLAEIKSQLLQDERIPLKGLGTFSTKIRAARDGRNPLTGKKMKLKEKTVVVFKASEELKKELA